MRRRLIAMLEDLAGADEPIGGDEPGRERLGPVTERDEEFYRNWGWRHLRESAEDEHAEYLGAGGAT